VNLRFAKLEFTPWGAFSEFHDGSRWGAQPHDEPHYHALAHRLGYEGDTLAYCREHELAHHLISEHFVSHSPVLWALAHGEQPPAMIAAAEESLALNLQRYARTNEYPMVDRVNWHALRSRFLELLSDPDGLGSVINDMKDEGDAL
jgi:hypothetical protein